jgi:hypothetical protein
MTGGILLSRLAWPSIPTRGGDRDARADGPSLLKLVYESDREVIGTDGALAVLASQQLIAAKAVGSRVHLA